MPIKKYDKPNKTIQCIRMLKILKSKKYLKKAEIAYLLGEETTRNINNYKNTLYDAGYPIAYKPGPSGGYYLEFDMMMPRTSLNETDLKALSTSYEYLMKESHVPHKKVLLDYLGNAFLENHALSSHEDLALYGHFPLSMPLDEIEKRYYMIQTAIDSKRKVKILYRGYHRDHYKIIAPYKLFKYENWIVFAYDESIVNKKYSKYNSFKLHRILEIELLEDMFTISPQFDESVYFDRTGQKTEWIHVKLKIFGKIGRMLDERIYGQNQVVTCLDDQEHVYLFEADMKNDLVIYKFILSFGSRCEVIEPLRLRQAVIDDAEATVEYYKTKDQKIKYYFTEQSLCNNSGYHLGKAIERSKDEMLIKGKYSRAIVYTDMIDEGAVSQIKALCDIEAFKDAKIRIMPDVHKGKGCVIGFTADLGEKVIPNIVGVDIGCGMLTVKLGQASIDLQALDAFIHREIPNGKSIYQEKQVDFMDKLNELKLLKDARQALKKWNRAIGSLGGGNHFIEINVDEANNHYLVIHSGSRNLGHVVASHYQEKAIEYHSGYNDLYMKRRQDLIDDYKSRGKRHEIKEAIKDLKAEFYIEKELPDDMCYLEGSLREDYLNDMAICQEFAELSREIMAKKIVNFLFGHTDFDMFHTTHNYIDLNDAIVRKGAIKAEKGQEVLIPINMRDGSILAVGKGNPDWNCSAPHGAGRLLSRTQAFDTLDFDEFVQEMKGVYSTSVTQKTLDESPMAYKSIEDITQRLEETVDMISILKPIYNFKSQR